MNETNTWTCDTCGGVIQHPKDGWVEWLRPLAHKPGQRLGSGLRLVHSFPASPVASKCQYNEQEETQNGSAVQDLPLKEFLGPDGLMRLLSKLALGELPQDEVLGMIKRLHVPGYEAAHPHFANAKADGAFESHMPEDYYSQSNIRSTLDWMKENE